MNKTKNNNPNWKGGNSTMICAVCGLEYPISRRKRELKRKFCSHTCRGKYFSGSMNSNWLGENGKNRDQNERQRIIISREYLIWRKSILDRDGWKCFHCGSKSNLIAHHIKCYWDYPEERFNMLNGMTVCRSCHTNIHLNKVLFVNFPSEITREISDKHTSDKDMIRSAMRVAEIGRNDQSISSNNMA